MEEGHFRVEMCIGRCVVMKGGHFGGGWYIGGCAEKEDRKSTV